MLDQMAPARRRMWIALLALLGLAVVVAAVFLVVDRAGQDRADQAELGPVVVVPGYGGQVATVQPIVDALRDAGRDVAVVKPADGGTGDLEAQTDELDRVARSAMDESGSDSVDVVGYSAGGVVARLWVRDGGGDEIARRVVTVGSPHHGTDVAALASQVAGCPVACQQLDPDSDLLRALNARDETPDGPAWVTLRSTSDAVVTPSESAELDGALNLVVQEFCPDRTTAHTALPADPVVLAALDSTLGPASPRIPVDTPCR